MNLRLTTFSCCIVLLASMIALAGCRKEEPPPPQEVVRYVEKPLAAVAGTLAVPEGMDPRGIMVYAEGSSHIALTSGDGRFVLSGLPEGEYTVRASRGDLESISLGDLAISEEELNRPQPFRDFGVISMMARDEVPSPEVAAILSQGSVRGKVLTTDPSDAEGVVVEIVGTPMRTVTLGDGSYVFINVPQGNYQLQFRKSEYRSQTTGLVVEPGAENLVPDVRLSLLDPASLGGRLVIGSVRKIDGNGNPLPGLEDVNVYLEGTPFNTVVSSNGRFEISGLPGGVYTVSAQAPGFVIEQPFQVDLSEIEAAEVNLTLRQDPNAVAQLGTVIGQVYLQEAPSTGMAGVTVSLIGTSSIVMTDPEGLFIIENVRPGMYDLIATMSGYENGLVTGIEVTEQEPVAVPLIELLKAVEAPKVVRTAPSNGAVNVSITDPTLVLITFSQKMDPESLIQAISISPDVEHQVAVYGQHPLAREDQAVIILAGFTRDGAPLRFNQRYQINVSRAATSMEGVAMKEPYRFSFTTGPAKIVGTWPDNGQRNVWIWYSSPIRVYFNAPIDAQASDYEADDIRVRPSLSTQPEFYFQNDGRTGWSYMSISGPFLHDEEYTVTLRGRLKTITGDSINNLPYTFRFRTAQRWEGLNRYDERTRREMLDQEKRRK